MLKTQELPENNIFRLQLQKADLRTKAEILHTLDVIGIDAEGIPPNQFSSGLESFGIHLQCERFESAKARTGSPFGTVVQIQKGANEDQTLKSLEFVSQSLYLKDARKKIKRLLVKPATVRVSACVRHSCMHLQRALRLSI